MNEAEVETQDQAAFFLATEVLNEYHGFPVIHRADVGGPNKVYIFLGNEWFEMNVTKVSIPRHIEKLEELASHADI